MTITIEAPGGVVIDFPDDTAPDAIRDAMTKATGGGFSPPPVNRDPGYVEDVARSVPAGLARGTLGIPGFIGDVSSILDWGPNYAILKGAELAGLLPNGKTAEDFRKAAQKIGGPEKGSIGAAAERAFTPPTGSDLQGVAEAAVPQLGYEPKTIPGNYAKTAGEFAPGFFLGAGTTGQKIAQVLGPAVTSETAGQVTKGSRAEPLARMAGAIVGGVGTALAQRAPSAERAMSSVLDGVSPADVKAASAFIDDAARQGIAVTWDEAINHITNGAAGQLTGVRHVVERSPGGAGILNPVMAARPGQIRGAAESAIGNVAPSRLDPVNGAIRAQNAARSAIANTPEGVALAERLSLNAPRVTADDAGAIIQPELRAIYDRREGMRAALGDKDYSAARNAPAEIPLDGGFGFREVTSHSAPPPVYPVARAPDGKMRRMTVDEIAAAELRAPIPVNPVVRGEGGRMRRLSDAEIEAEAARRASDLEASRAQMRSQLNRTEIMPIIGLEPTRFGQVDASGVLRSINEALATAKGAAKQGLEASRKALFTPNGELDTSVAGLHGSREAISDLIGQAKIAGANNTVRELEAALKTLDSALESVPAYGLARQSFRAASDPLRVFDDARIPGKIIAKDQYNNDFVMPRDAAPRAIETGGATAARDFQSVASRPAQDAFQDYFASRIVDGATDARGNLSLDRLAQSMRDQEDILRVFPQVRTRMEDIARARLGLEPVERSPLGQVAKADTLEAQGQALLPNKPMFDSAPGIADAVRRMASKDPEAAANLIHSRLRTAFEEATQNLQTGENKFGGAKFAAVIRGNGQQKANLEAAVKALPNGDQRWAGLDTYLSILEATGRAPVAGSATAFNQAIQKELGKGGIAQEMTKAAGTAGVSWIRKADQMLSDMNAGRNSQQIARILVSPSSGKLLERLASLPPRSQQARVLALRLSYMGRAGLKSESSSGEAK